MATEMEKDKKTIKLDIEIEIAKRDGLYFPEAGLPDYDAIKEVFGFEPQQLQKETFPSQKGKVKPKLTGIYTYTENDFVGMNGDHVRSGADVEI